ncbi:thylakoid membrane photosystem I accumulation factor [Synechococcus sp. M16CYN]|uniref:thylakoid membrane photosystem I accumulation factor n=1 Tax=Synechococcus sp. M16CYN TaxID=3103139 RepID=UPI00324ACB61
MTSLLCLLLSTFAALLLGVSPAGAVLNSDSYDGNIYALYAGNGSLVPSVNTLDDAMEAGRTAVIVYYLDDSAVSKRFAPVVSELQRLWGRGIDLIPLTTDRLQGRATTGVSDPLTYWHGLIPQVVVIRPDGQVVFDREGQVPLAAINEAISSATGLPAPNLGEINQEGSFNEVNIEVTAH